MVSEQERRENALLKSVLFTFFVSGAASQPLGSFIPFLRQAYGLGYDVSGGLLSAQSIGNLLAVLAVGILPAYLGRRRTVVLSGVWMAVGYLIFISGVGWAPLLALACLMTGIARGGNTNFANTMVSTLPGQKAARGYNLLHAAYAVGAILSPILLILCSNRWPGFGWKLVAGALALLVVAQVTVYARMGLPEERFGKGRGALDLRFLRVKTFWLGAVMLFFYISTEYAICGWLVTYFQDTGALSKDYAQLTNSLYWVTVFAGRMAGAWLTGKVSRKLLLTVDAVGVLTCFLLMLSASTPLAITLSLLGVGVFMATIYPSAFAFGSETVKGNDLGCSVLILVGTLGGILTPGLVGLVAERVDIRAGMAVVAGAILLLLCTILLSVFLTRKEKDGD